MSVRRAATFRNATDYARGRGDFTQLARDANALIREPPNSGTPGRLRIGARAVGSAIGTGLGGLLGMGAGPWGAVAGAGTLGSIGAVAAPIAQSRFVMHPRVQQYLRSGRFQPPDAATRRMRLLRHAAPFAAHQMANPYRAEGGAVDTPFDDAINYPPQGSEFPAPPPSRMDQAFDKSVDRWKQLGKDAFFAPARALKDFNESPTFSNALGVMPMGNIGKVANSQRMSNFWRRLGPEDARLSGEPGRAVDSWVGGPHNTKELGLSGGLMMPERLESMSPAGWEQMSQPVRQIARESFGDLVPVYRGIGGGGQSHGRLNQLASYTTDPKVAEYFAGVKRDLPIFSEAEIRRAEQTLANKGEVTIAGTTFRPSEHDYSGRGYLDMFDRNGDHITDTESLRAYLGMRNAERAEVNAANAAARKRVYRHNLSIGDILWATDRFNQKEIIGRSNPYRP